MFVDVLYCVVFWVEFEEGGGEVKGFVVGVIRGGDELVEVGFEVVVFLDVFEVLLFLGGGVGVGGVGYVVLGVVLFFV